MKKLSALLLTLVLLFSFAACSIAPTMTTSGSDTIETQATKPEETTLLTEPILEEPIPEITEATVPETTVATTPETTAATEYPEPETTVATESALKNGIRPEFKKAMDDYEEFFDKYCEFMKKYSSDESNDLSLLAEYLDYLTKVEEMSETFEKWDDEDLSKEEEKYYLEVELRVAMKLLDIAN